MSKPIFDRVSYGRDDYPDPDPNQAAAPKDAVSALAEAMSFAWPTSFRGYETETPAAQQLLRDYAYTILAALPEGWRLSRVDETPPDALDAAWKAAEAALPEGWAFAGLYLSRKMQVWTARVYRIGEKHPFGKPGEGVIATDGGTPQAALNGLAALLNATPPASSLDGME